MSRWLYLVKKTFLPQSWGQWQCMDVSPNTAEKEFLFLRYGEDYVRIETIRVRRT
jgi:hypothetical protein